MDFGPKKAREKLSSFKEEQAEDLGPQKPAKNCQVCKTPVFLLNAITSTFLFLLVRSVFSSLFLSDVLLPAGDINYNYLPNISVKNQNLLAYELGRFRGAYSQYPFKETVSRD